MTPLQIGLYLLAGLTGAAVVPTRDPRRQAIVMGFNGLVLALLFLVLQAPDVAYSELAVNTVAVPSLFLVTLAAARINKRRRQEREERSPRASRGRPSSAFWGSRSPPPGCGVCRISAITPALTATY